MIAKRLRFFVVVTGLAMAIIACKPSPEPGDPRQQLASLREQAKQLNQQIRQLELQIASSDSTGSTKKARLVQVDTLKKQNFAYFIDVQGLVESDLNLLVSPQMPGVVAAIYVREGDRVTQGKVLASLDASALRKGLEEVKTGLALATTVFEKQQKLWDQQIGSELQYLQAKNGKEQLEQKLKTLEAQLAMTTIRAPVSGVVDQVLLKLGEMANPGMQGIRVVNNQKMKIKANISDRYIAEVKQGDKVLVEIPERGLELSSRINYCSNYISPRTRTFSIEVGIPSNGVTFHNNQAVRLKVNSRNVPGALVVSSNLIQTSISGEQYVLVAEESNGFWFARRRTVVAGIAYQGQTEISEGLLPGDKVIVSGYSELVDGQMITL